MGAIGKPENIARPVDLDVSIGDPRDRIIFATIYDFAVPIIEGQPMKIKLSIQHFEKHRQVRQSIAAM